MSGSPKSIVIVGAGIAGISAAETLRDEGYDGRILLFDHDSEATYERPPLSKEFLARSRDEQSIRLREPSALASRGIEFEPGESAASLDVRSRSVRLSGGKRVTYDRLLLATGMAVRRLNVALEGDPPVYYLRTLADARAVRDRLATGTRVLIIGAGYIGLEVAATARSLGCEVVVLEAAHQPLARIGWPTLSTFVADQHRSAGVKLWCGRQVERIAGSASGAAVVLDDGETLEADLIVVGVGALPNTSLLADTGMDVSGGVVVDQGMATAIPAVFAAGDVARFWSQGPGCMLRLESWQNAERHGRIAAKRMLGKSATYAETPWFWTDQYAFNIQMLGTYSQWDTEIARGRPDTGQFSLFLMHQGRIVGAAFINDGRNVRPTRVAMDAQRLVDADRLADTSQPLASAFSTAAAPATAAAASEIGGQ